MLLKFKGSVRGSVYNGKRNSGNIEVKNVNSSEFSCNLYFSEWRDLLSNEIKSHRFNLDIRKGISDKPDISSLRDSTKKIINEYDILIGGDVPYMSNIGWKSQTLMSKIIPLVNKDIYTDICKHVSTNVNKYETSISLVLSKDGTDFYGTNIRNILFGINNGNLVYHRRFISDEWVDDRDCDEGGYRVDSYYIDNIKREKDGSLVLIKTKVVEDYEYTDVAKYLLELPVGLECFNETLYTGLLYFRYNSYIESDYRLNHSGNYDKHKLTLDNIKDSNTQYHTFVKDKAILIASGRSYNSGGMVLFKYFDNVTDEGKWKEEIAKRAIETNMRKSHNTEKYYNDKLSYDEINLGEMDIIVTVVKDGINIITTYYDKHKEINMCGGIYKDKIRDILSSICDNMASTGNNIFHKRKIYTLDTKSKALIVETVETISQYSIINMNSDNSIYGCTHEYTKVIFGGKLQYLLTYMCDADSKYVISPIMREEPTHAFQHSQSQGSLYNNDIIMWRYDFNDTDKNSSRIFRHYDVQEYHKTKSTFPITDLVFDKPSMNIDRTIFNKYEFELTTEKNMVHNRYVDNSLIRNTFIGRYSGYDSDSVFDIAGVLKERPRRLLHSQYKEYLADMIKNKDIHQIYSGDIPSFAVQGSYKHTCGNMNLYLIVKHIFSYNAELLDDAALQYCRSHLMDIEFESNNWDTVYKSVFTDDVKEIKNNPYMEQEYYDSLIKVMTYIDTLCNERLFKLSSNRTKEDENKVFKTDIERLTFIAAGFENLFK